MKTNAAPRVLFWMLFALLAGPVVAASDPALVGKVVYVDGEVTANGQVTDTGDQLSGPVILKTGKGAELEVVFGGKNVFRLGPDTVVKVDFSQLHKTVNLEQGVFTSVLKKLSQTTGSAFVLRTPTMNAGVRGTSFHVSTDGVRTYFCTCNGSVDLQDATGGQDVVLTNAHHGAKVFTKQADGSILVEAGGLEGHTDASIETLAQKIDVSVDWSKPDLKHN